MAIRLNKKAVERSTYVITIEFRNENGNLVTPNSATWTLTDENGSIINSRQDVAISSPSSTETVALTGADLAIQSGETGYGVRYFTVEAEYDSDAGSGLSLTEAAQFTVENLIAVT